MNLSIERLRAVHKSLRPEVEAVLRGLPPHFLFHEQHHLRHPLASYTASLHAIEGCWTDVLALHERARIEVAMGVEPIGQKALSNAYRSLLERLNEHIDTAHSILRSLRPPLAGNRPRTHGQFLDATKLPGWKAFKKTVHEGYRVPRLGRIVNLMKHEGAELRETHLLSRDTVALGFYVEGARGPGVIGPHRDVHAPWRQCETAISYAFDMPLHFHWLFQVSESVRHCIELILRQDHGLTTTPVHRPDEATSGWSKLCVGISGLAPDFFPDERERRRVVVICNDDASILRIRAEAPGRRPRDESYQVSSVVMPMEGALSVMPPYFPKQAMS